MSTNLLPSVFGNLTLVVYVTFVPQDHLLNIRRSMLEGGKKEISLTKHISVINEMI